MTVHVYVYENTQTKLWFESLVVCEGGPWVLIREYDKDIPDPPGPGGTTDYNQLSNLPSINNVQVKGSKSSEQYNIINMTQAEKTKLTGLADIKQIGEGLALDPSTGTLSNTGGQGGTVDQTYNAESANAQSGKAVAQAVRSKAEQSSVLALQNSLETVRTEAEGTQAELTQFKSDYVLDMASKQTMAVINWQYEFFFAELLEMLKCGGAVIEWGNQTYMPVVGFEDKVVEGVRTINAFVHATASIDAITLLWFTWTVAEADKETVKMSPDSYYHSVGAVGVPWVAAQLSYKQDTLISGENIKTINGQSVVGGGNLEIGGGNVPYVYWDDAIFGYTAEDGESFSLTCDQDTDRKIDVKFRNTDPTSTPKEYTVPTKVVTDELQTQIDTRVGTHFEVGVEKWYGTYTDDGVTYQVYSKIINIGALPSAAGTTQYPHGITGIKQILQINGFTNDGFVMNAPRQTAADNISIYQVQKSGNIAVEVGKDRSSKNGFVMLIYAKNN